MDQAAKVPSPEQSIAVFRSDSRRYLLYLVFGVLYIALGVLGLVRDRSTFVPSTWLLMGLMWLPLGVVMKRRSFVELHSDGVVVADGLRKRRYVPWVDVTHLYVDPPGGARLVRLNLGVGALVTLPRLSDADRSRVEEAYRAAKRGEGGSGQGGDSSIA